MKAVLRSIQFSADALGVSHYTIRRLIDAGEIQAVHIGARRLVPEDEIERVASQGTGPSKSVMKSSVSDEMRQQQRKIGRAGDAPDPPERHRETAAKVETVTAPKEGTR